MKITSLRKSNWTLVAASVLAGLGLGTLTFGQGAPTIVSTSPRIGQKDVDPATTEITVTFDRDMQAGFSWTGGGPEYPETPPGKKPFWRDRRTCVLTVKLYSGHSYRVGINSPSYRNFCSAQGVPVQASAITFTTSGTAVVAPRIVGLTPRNGTKDVSPDLAEIRVTFNVAMGGGFSWCGEGPAYPDSPKGKAPYWTEDHKTCVMPVSLKPGHKYELGLNCPCCKGFQTAAGVPLDPINYTFTTKN